MTTPNYVAIHDAIGRVTEGQCPLCRQPLHRTTQCGWCPDCDTGWSVTTHRHTKTQQLSRWWLRDGEPRITRWYQHPDQPH